MFFSSFFLDFCSYYELQTNTTTLVFSVVSFPGELSVGVLVEVVAVILAQAPDPDPPQTLSHVHDLDQENPGSHFFFIYLLVNMYCFFFPVKTAVWYQPQWSRAEGSENHGNHCPMRTHYPLPLQIAKLEELWRCCVCSNAEQSIDVGEREEDTEFETVDAPAAFISDVEVFQCPCVTDKYK